MNQRVCQSLELSQLVDKENRYKHHCLWYLRISHETCSRRHHPRTSHFCVALRPPLYKSSLKFFLWQVQTSCKLLLKDLLTINQIRLCHLAAKIPIHLPKILNTSAKTLWPQAVHSSRCFYQARELQEHRVQLNPLPSNHLILGS